MAKGSNSQTNSAPPLASRRNFRLSPLEIMVGVLIGVAVLYLITVWFGGGSSREVENATPAIVPGSMVERAVASSEKVLAEQVELSREVGSLRKQVEAIQANRGGGTSGAVDASQDRRLDELEKRLDQPTAAPAPAADPKLVARLETLEKALKERPAPAAPAVDPGLDARLKALEAESGRQLAALQRQVKELTAEVARQEKGVAADRRLAALERRLTQIERHPAAEPHPEPKAVVREQTRPEIPPVVKPAPRHEPEAKRISHKVKPGETLMGLSRRYKVSVEDIVRWNAQQLGDRRLLFKGETIVIFASGES